MVNGNKGNPPSVDGNEYKEDEKRKPEKKTKFVRGVLFPTPRASFLQKIWNLRQLREV